MNAIPEKKISGSKAEERSQKVDSPQEESAERAGPPSFWFRRNWLSPTKLQIALMVFNLATLVTAVFLYWSTQVQVKISGEQLKLSHKSSESQLRAYLNITFKGDSLAERYSKAIKDTTLFHFPFFIKNVGQTPAYKFIYATELVQKDSVLDSDFDTSKQRILRSPIVLNPGVEYYDFNMIDPTPANQKNPRVFFFGQLNFVDAFDSSHYVRFCFEYVHLWKRFFPYYKYNDAN